MKNEFTFRSEKELFLEGVKPALLLEEVSKENEKLLKKYPRYTDEYSTIFFQDKKGLENFKEYSEIFPKRTLLGLTLGYPIVAVEYFEPLDAMSLMLNGQYHCAANYKGLNFCFNAKDIETVISQLNEDYPSFKDDKHSISFSCELTGLDFLREYFKDSKESIKFIRK